MDTMYGIYSGKQGIYIRLNLQKIRMPTPWLAVPCGQCLSKMDLAYAEVEYN